MNRLLFDNPVLIKHIRIRLRRPQAIYLGIVVLCLCLCVMWAGLEFDGLDNGFVFTLLVWCMGGCCSWSEPARSQLPSVRPMKQGFWIFTALLLFHLTRRRWDSSWAVLSANT